VSVLAFMATKISCHAKRHIERAPQSMRFPASSTVPPGLAGDDGGDILGADAMKVQMKAAGKFTPGSRG
jgi:hypothetical protein